MITRDALNYLGQKIGEVNFVDGTSEEVIAAKLAQYAVAPVDPSVAQQLYLKKNIKERKEYADDLIERFKALNINSSITAIQALWLQHRMRALEINVDGLPLIIDVMNLCVSGDVEVACIALQYAVVDDMTMPFHWFSAQKRDWLVVDMKAYLGWS